MMASATGPLSVPLPTDSAALLRDPPGFIGRAPADDFQPRPATTDRTLSELALLTEEEFREQFKGSPVKRAKRRGCV